MSTDYSNFQETVNNEQMQQLSRLSGEYDKLEGDIATKEAELKALAERKRSLTENDIPQLMMAAGCKEITTLNGLKVTLKEEVRASFPSRDKDPGKRKDAFDWLTENGHSGLIKHNLTVKFTRGEREQADKVVEHLKTLGIQLDMDRDDTVHHQTLLAFLREQVRDGAEIPLDKFGAFIQTFAKITKGK